MDGQESQQWLWQVHHKQLSAPQVAWPIHRPQLCVRKKLFTYFFHSASEKWPFLLNAKTIVKTEVSTCFQSSAHRWRCSISSPCSRGALRGRGQLQGSHQSNHRWITNCISEVQDSPCRLWGAAVHVGNILYQCRESELLIPCFTWVL